MRRRLISLRRVDGILSFAAPPLIRDGALNGTIEITADADGTVWVGGAATGYIRGIITL